MTLTIDLSPELESRLLAEASRRGLDAGSFVVATLNRQLGTPSDFAAPTGCVSESELLEKINAGLPEEVWRRFHELIALRREERLSELERRELVELADRVEAMNSRRLEWLLELARMRNVSLASLMETLGIQSPPYV